MIETLIEFGLRIQAAGIDPRNVEVVLAPPDWDRLQRIAQDDADKFGMSRNIERTIADGSAFRIAGVAYRPAVRQGSR